MSIEKQHDQEQRDTSLPTCTCGGQLNNIDSFGRSSTAQCDSCNACYLVVAEGSGDPVVILLRKFRGELILPSKFDERRGEGLDRRFLDNHTMADGLMVALAADGWPAHAQVVEFGIQSSLHYDALQEAARLGVSAYEFDRVLGDGKAITELVRAVTTDTQLHVEFETPYDRFYGFEGHVSHDRNTTLAKLGRHRQVDESLDVACGSDHHEPELER